MIKNYFGISDKCGAWFGFLQKGLKTTGAAQQRTRAASWCGRAEPSRPPQGHICVFVVQRRDRGVMMMPREQALLLCLASLSFLAFLAHGGICTVRVHAAPAMRAHFCTLSMLMHALRALCISPGQARSVWTMGARGRVRQEPESHVCHLPPLVRSGSRAPRAREE